MDARNLNNQETDLLPEFSKAESFDSRVAVIAFALNQTGPPDRTYLIIKRTFDLIAALIGLVLLSPIFIVIIAAVKLDSAGPVFFTQIRVGRGMRFFKILKFRTMYVDTSSSPLLIKDQFTMELRRPNLIEDPRLTRAGRFLRKMSLDEIPQLLNILIGEMTFIGPRPLTVDESINIPTVAVCRYVNRPGLSGLAQIRNRSAIHGSSRFDSDIEYTQRRSFWLDMEIFFKSFTKFYNLY